MTALHELRGKVQSHKRIKSPGDSLQVYRLQTDSLNAAGALAAHLPVMGWTEASSTPSFYAVLYATCEKSIAHHKQRRSSAQRRSLVETLSVLAACLGERGDKSSSWLLSCNVAALSCVLNEAGFDQACSGAVWLPERQRRIGLCLGISARLEAQFSIFPTCTTQCSTKPKETTPGMRHLCHLAGAVTWQ